MSSSKVIFNCDECSYSSIRKFDLERHKNTHKGKFKREKCTKTFKTRLSSKLHKKHCLESNKLFAKESDARLVEIKKDPDEEILSECRSGIDPEEREIEQDLLMSLRAIAECDDKVEEVEKKTVIPQKPSRTHKCPHCLYKSVRLYDMKRHSLIHGDLYKCESCNASFNTIIGFQNHDKFHRMQAVEMAANNLTKKNEPKKITSIERFSCPTCSQTFTILKNLRRHQKFHSDFIMYECSYCPASFKRKDYHKSHERRHLNSTRLRVTKTAPDAVKIEPSTKPIKPIFTTCSNETEFASIANTILDDFNDDEFLGLLEEIKSQPDLDQRYQNLDDVEFVPNDKEELGNKNNSTAENSKVSKRSENQKIYGCGECELEFETNLDLWNHLKVQHFL